MHYVNLPEKFPLQRLPFYLAMEEYLARHMQGEFFFMWRVSPTVICGRNQNIADEVNVEFCRANDIDIVRRRSGGGTVYANPGNIMMSYITDGCGVQTIFADYTARVASMLRSLGLNAAPTGRNDLFVDGCKVSGNAFYHIGNRNIVHGTMLYDTNFNHLLSALTPTKQQLKSKYVKSSPSQVTTLNRYLSMDIEEFMAYAKRYMCDDDVIELTESDIDEIRLFEQRYYLPQWLNIDALPSADMEGIHIYIEGVGTCHVHVKQADGKIVEAAMQGDYFEIGNLKADVLDQLKGVDFTADALKLALSNVDMTKVIVNLTTEEFIKQLTR